MALHAVRRTTPLLLLAGWLAAGPVVAATPAVRDGARLFSPEAVRAADRTLRLLRERYETPVLIETFPSVSPLARLVHNFNNPEARQRYFRRWAEREARKAGPDAIYILVCREPGPVEVVVEVGEQARARGFGPAEADRLESTLADRLRAGASDAGLRDALADIQTTLAAHQGQAVAPAEPFPWGGVLTTLLVVLALWGCARVVQGVRAGREGTGIPPIGPLGAGSIPAGLFATMTGGWLRGFWQATPAHPEATPPADEHDDVPPDEPHDLDFYHQGAGHGEP